MTDKTRNYENKLEELLEFFPVVIILGARQCGKTTLAKKMRPNWRYFDLEKSRDFNLITEDIDFFFREHSHSLVIDEAQRYPNLFQELRGVIDGDRHQKNRFILTGSSSLELIKNVSETLAGRVGIIELGTFKTNEYFDFELPDFYQIFEQKITEETKETLKQLETSITYENLINSFLSGGYPEPILANNDRILQTWMENYFDTYVQRDIRILFPRLNLIKYQRFIAMLAALNGTIINRSQVARSLDVTEKSVRDYLDIAAGSYVWQNIRSYEKSVSKSIIKMPKGHFRDSGLAHYIQGIRNREGLFNYPSVGNAFEAFVIEEIIKGVQVIRSPKIAFYYYRTRNGAEIDLILEGDFGTLPIEIKWGSTVKQRQLLSLKAFIKTYQLPLGIVVNNADCIEMIADKIIQIPARFL
ncbi:MAG: ATP-binding protein [Deltaproteobacteria bacterium]|jgi:uncharacterized protein|nr:ATP-binding protein [Deltaproteobacteria bacterium]MBT4525260.1 ATP-binding protein [Deltaproteobacteria bacterium]